MSRIGGNERHVVGVFDDQPPAGPGGGGHITDGLLRIGQMKQQGAAVHQVIGGGLEPVSQDVVAADLHPGLFRVG